eukprot:c10485_g1_i1.p1 GENE.c10485_g1_i1~~c10485_g1_i1.p1  ORF type:complete len:184 (+),score=41.82 c10485_g1_i1:61-552(+)
MDNWRKRNKRRLIVKSPKKSSIRRVTMQTASETSPQALPNISDDENGSETGSWFEMPEPSGDIPSKATSMAFQRTQRLRNTNQAKELFHTPRPARQQTKPVQHHIFPSDDEIDEESSSAGDSSDLEEQPEADPEFGTHRSKRKASASSSVRRSARPKKPKLLD